jgi:hypothetical protein
MHDVRFALTLVSFATAAILISLHVFVPIPKKGSLAFGDTPIQRRIRARRAELARFASLAPNSTTSIVVQPGQACPTSDISRLTFKDYEKQAIAALGWSWVETDLEPDFAVSEPWAQI